MDFHALSRRELQALCKRNAIRANMSNAAMVEALRSLPSPSVGGAGEIGRTVPPPAMVAMKPSSSEEEVTVLAEQGHGLPPPRIRRARAKARKAGACKTEEEGPGPRTLQSSGEAAAPVDVDEVAATAKTRTRRSTRSNVKKMDLDNKEEQKADSSGAAIGSAVASDKSCQDPKEHQVVTVVEEDVTKSEEGQNETRRAVAKKRTRGSTRSKEAPAPPKGLNADSSDMTVGPAVVSYKDEAVAMLEESTKPQEGNKVTRMATVYKAQEVQQAKMMVEPESVTLVDNDEVATAKRRRRSARSKVAVAKRKGKKADSSDATIASAVLVYDQGCDYPEEEQVVAVVDEGAKKPNEGTTKEQDQISTVHNSASLVEVEDSPIVSVTCKEHAANVSYKAPVSGEEVDDCFTITGDDDQSNLLVNPLDRFAKPKYEFTVKGEKKSSECWWMLM